MKLLLTGLPGTGKTTLLQTLIPLLEDPFWVLCREIRNAAGQRVGFEVEASTGSQGLLAHKQDIQSTAVIGDYRVDLGAIDALLSDPIADAMQAHTFLLIDEIGRMQMLSDAFTRTIRQLCVGEYDFIATIRYGDDWTREFTDQPDIITLVLSPENRDQAEAAVRAMLETRTKFSALTNEQKQVLLKMAKAYGQNGQTTQLRKLYRNAVRYVVDNRVKQLSEQELRVAGNHGNHEVRRSAGTWICDCDLFNGRNEFAGEAGECSHIQAVRLSQQLSEK